ncbi:MAG: phytanoyl-CoA dioxygenase family protein, partial [Deltaproteobacteria bacterium]|nr:phytanoyl-CoA dioxygenase family protein [Deltaproteobacteria bacterium]
MGTSLSTFETDAPISEIASALKEDGGIIFRNLVAEELMDEIYAEILENTSNAERKSTGNQLWPEGNRTVAALAAASVTFTENLLLHSKILETVDAMLLPMKRMSPRSDGSDRSDDKFASFRRMAKNDAGSKQVVMRATDSERGPNCHHYNLGASSMLEVHRGGQHQFLHRENSIYQPFVEQFPQTREFLVSVLWAGTDFTLENGATRLVPGSHEWPENRIAKESEIAQAVMTKGSVVVWLSRTLHGAGA